MILQQAVFGRLEGGRSRASEQHRGELVAYLNVFTCKSKEFLELFDYQKSNDTSIRIRMREEGRSHDESDPTPAPAFLAFNHQSRRHVPIYFFIVIEHDSALFHHKKQNIPLQQMT